MMLIQTPGSFVWAGSLAARLGKEGWSAWGVYLVTGCLQGSLLSMGIYFEYLERQRRSAALDENGVPEGAEEELDGENDDEVIEALAGNGSTERTPLLK